MLVLTILFILMMLSSLSSSLRTHNRYRYKNLYNHLSTTILKSSTTSSNDILNKNSNNDILNKIGAAGLAQAAQAAVVAASAVNQAVGMRDIQAPDVEKTYVFRDGASLNRIGVVDSVGLPLVYDKKLIESYWKSQGSALTSRWTEFLGYAIPYLTRVITLLISGGSAELKKNGGALAKDARIIFESLGPTYVKLGQMMSVRPDVLPKEALDELKILQDSVKPFDTETAIKQIESELGGDLSQFFSEISIEPVAAASLAQVYKAKLNTGEWVAVKVQRPAVLETVSKDLYVLRRAAEVYQGLTDRFAPQQKTNYVSLFNEWAVGFYTELDFLNEAANQQRLKELLIEQGVTGVYVPTVYHSLCRRRVLVTEWIDGKKLSESPPDIIKELIVDAQEAFLIQLLQVGFFHSDPHPGNIMVMNTPRDSAKMALIDFGLVASIKQKDMDSMISAIIHLANKDYPSLVDDFIRLEILPNDCDRAKVIPLMDKAISPYVKGGGAQGYEKELKKIYGMDGTISASARGFQAMTQDAITVLNDIPFSIPPYFALLGRAIVTLEGIALTGDPNYGIIQEAYPFVARKLLSEDRPEIQKALQEVLYAKGNDGFKAARLSVLLNSALGIVSRSDSFVDFDTVPEDSLKPGQLLKYLFSQKATSLRNLLTEEAINAGDILLRQAARKSFISLVQRLPKLPFFSNILPTPESIPLPFLIPKAPISTDLSKLDPSLFQVTLLQPNKVLEAAAPKLSLEEELYAISLTDLTKSTLGSDAAVISSGDVILDPAAAARFLLSIASTGKIPLISSSQSVDVSKQLLRLISPSLKTNENENEILKDMTEGLNDLNEDETKILQDTLSNIIYKINEKVINRLQPLIL